MTTTRHGISMGMERTDGEFFLSIKPVGKLTHQDYEQLSPMLEDVIRNMKNPHVRVYIDITDFKGWEAKAMWDDLKLDVKYDKVFDKIAIFGHGSKMEKGLTRVSDWFMHGDVRFFDDSDDAMTWLAQ